MKRNDWLRFILVAAVSLTAFTGCSDNDDDDDGAILRKGQKDNLRVGIEESIVNIPDPGTGRLTALVSWNGPQRIRAYFTVSGAGTRMGDLTSAESPFEISGDTIDDHDYILYLGNPDGPAVVDVDYTVTFEAK